MTITNGYSTLAEFKQRVITGAATDAPRDADLEIIIADVSRMIDNETHCQFYVDSVASARYYTPGYDYLCFTDDFAVVTSLKLDLDGDGTYETTLTTQDYWGMPVNEAAKSWLQLKPARAYSFSLDPNSVELTATWGRATPGVIREACILQSSRIYARREAPLGVIAVNGEGQSTVIGSLDPDVHKMLLPYLKRL